MTTSLASPAEVERQPATPRRSAGRLAALALAIAIALLWAGYRRTPCGSEAGTAFQEAAASDARAVEKPTLRVATFNIHGGEGRDGRLDLQRTAACLAGADLVALNEVYGSYFWEGPGQAEILGRRTKSAWLFAPAEHRWGHDHFGNAALTSLAVRSWQRIPLPRQYGHSCRNLLLVSLDYRGRTIRAVITHLDRSDARDRSRQLQLASELFLGLAEPALLLGDMNTTADEPSLEQLLSSPGVGDPVAEVLGEKTPRRIDWILTRGLETVDAGLIDVGASDHPCVWAELRLPNASP
ncbi:MAG TPA: endonuclease/exonuclease/phosphatase family protein [Pirellulales bacterium]|jgi:endonuclease/exonuclease/phosphatase family metal-dependent hydrolase|nr:endonuclease/exonuclease/phosphatase family protein [Pirellulales bacterium]